MRRIREKLQEIKEELIDKILSNEYPAGSNFPSEHELCERYNLTRGYIRQVLQELQIEGYLIRSQGKRTIVATRDQYVRAKISPIRTTFAIAMQDQQTQHTQKILEGFMEKASDLSIQTISYNLYFDENTEYNFLKTLSRLGIDGVAFWPHYNNDKNREIVHKLVNQKFPIVLIDRYLPPLNTDAVVSQNRLIGERLTKCLIAKGHRRIAFITAELTPTSARQRYEGYLSALKESGLPCLPEHTVCSHPKELPISIYRVMAHKEKPTGMVFAYDILAEITFTELTRLGYKVPDDVEFATLCDENRPQTLKFPAWIFKQNSLEMGRLACERLNTRMANPNLSYELIEIPPVPSEPYWFPGVEISAEESKETV
ncbi:MAG: GntR family transcriptional regulator [Candidatus Hydrogenedentes bacterium]|nr:GntR family transcriptional regulator [Candidatus Hydrogenedentota bacterium]